MKNLLLFFLVCIIGTGSLLVGTTTKNPLPCFISALGVWLLFFYKISKR